MWSVCDGEGESDRMNGSAVMVTGGETGLCDIFAGVWIRLRYGMISLQHSVNGKDAIVSFGGRATRSDDYLGK